MTDLTIDELKEKISKLEIENSGLLMEREGFQVLIKILREEIKNLQGKK